MRFHVNAPRGVARLDRHPSLHLFLALIAIVGSSHAAQAGLWFDDPVSYSVPKTPRGLSVGYLNDDPYLDVFVAATTTNSATGYIYLNDGSGGLVAGPTVVIIPGYERHALGDFNGDGRTDIAVSGSPTRVYYASAAYTYPGPAVLVPLDAWPNGYFGEMRAEDLDQDGHCDLIGRPSNEGPQQPYLWIVWGSPTGLVPGNTEIVIDLVDDISCEPSLYSSVIDLAVADADVDGDLDIVVSAVRDWGIEDPPCERRGIGVIWCDGPRIYRESEEWTVKEQDPSPVDAFYMLKVPVLGGDSGPDIAMIDGITHKVMYSEGSGAWRAPEPSGLPGGWSVMADFDGDDVLDAVDGVYNKMWVNRGRSPSGFDLIESPDLPGLTPKAVGDLDGDGVLDVVSDVYPTTTMMVHRNIAPLATGVPEAIESRRLRAVPSVVSRGVVRFERVWRDGEGATGRGVEVRDVQGRAVWRSGSMEPGRGAVEWDLTDRRGGLVPAGIYFAVEAGKPRGEAARVLVIR